MKPFICILLLLILFFAGSVLGQTQGPNNPSTTGNQPLASCSSCVGAIWNNTSNVGIADNIYSDVQLQPYLSCFQSQCYRSRYLTCSGFGFSIPSNATVNGIMLTITGKSDIFAAVLDCTIVLMRNNSPAGTNLATGNDWDTTLTQRVYGSPTELWGLSWIPSQVNSSNFGVYIKVYNPQNSSPKVFIDEVNMVIYFSLGSSSYSQSSSPGTFHIFADPADQTFNLNFLPDELPGNALLRIADMSGKICYTENLSFVPGNAVSEKITVKDAGEGIYFCTLVTPAHIYTARLSLIK